MEEIIRDMVENLRVTHNENVAEIAKRLLDELASTYNAPSNWRNIPEKIAEEYFGDDWLEENLGLRDYYWGVDYDV